jgi:hypothetical protein
VQASLGACNEGPRSSEHAIEFGDSLFFVEIGIGFTTAVKLDTQ